MSLSQNPPLRGTGTAMPKISDVVSATLRKQGVQFELVTVQGLRGSENAGIYSERPGTYVVTNADGLSYVGSCSNVSVRMSRHKMDPESARGLHHVAEGSAFTVRVFYFESARHERLQAEQRIIDSLTRAGFELTNEGQRAYLSKEESVNAPSCYSDGEKELTLGQLKAKLGNMRKAFKQEHHYKGAGAIVGITKLERVRLPETDREIATSLRIERVMKGLDLALKFGQCEFLANALNEKGERGPKPTPTTPEEIKARLVELELLAPWM